MNALALCLAAALVGAAVAEPPSGYSYSRPSSGGGYSGGGGGGGYSGGGGLSGGGNYVQVSPGYSSNEGQQVDPQLLEKIRQILLQEESQASAQASSGGFGGYPSSPSSSYGVPSSSYGVPSGGYSSRVVGVDLEGVRQAIQVAQYQQTSFGQGGGGYPAAIPSSSYGAPSRPSSSYGAPF